MIDHLFSHYKSKCDNDTAAALLTVAAVLAKQGDRMLTVQQAAEVLQCSEDKIYQQCDAGTLPHKRVGRMIRIRESDLKSA
jgi:excisionase family DNA binding protein